MPHDCSAVAVDGASLYAAGAFLSAGGTAALRVAKWNGSQWSALGAGLDGTVNAVVMHGGALYAGGEFVASGAAAVNHVARWNGTAWVDVGGGIAGPVSHLVSHRGKLYAGSTCGTAACISAWDGAAWSPIPALTNVGDPATLTGLGSVDEDGAGPGEAFLYASGEFVTAGTVAAQRMARWDGVAWTAGGFGSAALDKPARAFAAFGVPPVVYAGGDFERVGPNGGTASWYLAGYDDCPTPCYANCDGSTIAPVLNINDYVCFQQRFGAGYPDANCDGSTSIPVLNVNDFICFMGKFAAGCE